MKFSFLYKDRAIINTERIKMGAYMTLHPCSNSKTYLVISMVTLKMTLDDLEGPMLHFERDYVITNDNQCKHNTNMILCALESAVSFHK